MLRSSIPPQVLFSGDQAPMNGEANQKKVKNIQQREFPGGHPPQYYFAGLQLRYGRADGIPRSL